MSEEICESIFHVKISVCSLTHFFTRMLCVHGIEAIDLAQVFLYRVEKYLDLPDGGFFRQHTIYESFITATCLERSTLFRFYHRSCVHSVIKFRRCYIMITTSTQWAKKGKIVQ